jgi:hypothetical protein
MEATHRIRRRAALDPGMNANKSDHRLGDARARRIGDRSGYRSIRALAPTENRQHQKNNKGDKNWFELTQVNLLGENWIIQLATARPDSWEDRQNHRGREKMGLLLSLRNQHAILYKLVRMTDYFGSTNVAFIYRGLFINLLWSLYPGNLLSQQQNWRNIRKIIEPIKLYELRKVISESEC